MAIFPKEGALLYHLTCIDNLENIIMNDLQPRSYLKEFIDVADKEILQSREQFNLEEYTPFHFFSGTPFAGSIQINHPEKQFIYITVKRDLASHNNFLVIPSHPLHYNGAPLDWNHGLDTINWDLMGSRDYKNSECKEVCMAEAIFKGRIPVKFFHCIYVKNNDCKDKVETLLKKHNCFGVIFVNVNPTMFVNHD